MRSPLQGGLPPTGAVVGAVVEIACDESGFSGTNLLHSTAPVITHASVDLVVDEAVALITALRSGFRFSPHEFKSGHFLRRSGADEALEWFLAALAGRAHVHLIDKEFFLVTRIVDFLLTEPSYAAGTRLARDHHPASLALYEAGRSAGSDWAAFLSAFVDLVRMKRRLPVDRTVQWFFQARDALRRHRLGVAADAVLDGLDPCRVRALVARLDGDDRSVPPPLEPLLPALAETVLSWSDGRRQVLVTHDEQSALTADRLTRLQRVLATGGASVADADPTGVLPDGVSPLAGLVTVDSRDDPRVQVADLLAGVARRMPHIIDGTLRQPPPRRRGG
ncbi:hypothetical protein FHG89_24000 [Micromonospora orduensis]|uniref:DUF3800 domain-containing protein n=1 Tax=Micromonospora orduensis TaxID=1420891 RepID=A0A5C4QF23_9ACTN|nr:hypothetical protein [Micromonospora orduensis]TNH24950.1 hypothetical protein FHG89_24000 [Micromonospora orduensis]